MKKYSWIFLLLSCTAGAQSLSPTVIASGGGSFVSTSSSIDFTVGEVAITTFTSTNTMLTQGFHQPLAHNTGIDVSEGNSIFCKVFPNPVSGILNIEFPDNNPGRYTASLCDMTGKELGRYTDIIPAEINTLQIPMDHYPQGMYFIKVQSLDGSSSSTIKIIKTSN